MTRANAASQADAATTHWDAVVVGGGMGGSAAASQMARAGLKVLVVEFGRQDFETSGKVHSAITDPEDRMAIGRWPVPLTASVDGDDREFYAPLGAGVGGSSLLYAAALDRLRPSDFATRPHPGLEADIGWPVSYETLEPYYQQAEAALGVTGTPDPLAPDMAYDLAQPNPMSDRDAWLFDAFEKAGLNPYRQHCGIEDRPGCDWCLARVCLSGCKRHGGNAFLAPAQGKGAVALLERTRVTRILAEGDRITGIEIDGDAGPRQIMARAVVLAAGAYFSPTLLLRSTCEDWPDGLANRHDQVGRNLMFHFGRALAIFTRRGLGTKGPKKAIALRDLYGDGGAAAFGEVQSTGAEARYGNVLYALRQQLDDSPLRRVPLLRDLLRIPAFVSPLIFGNAAIMALIMEDFPYPENRVMLDESTPSGMRFTYDISEELNQRGAAYARAVKSRLKGFPSLWLSTRPNLNYGHPCGTCRAGTDPATSVVDAGGKAHSTQNLYVADASFMPTSGGTNPSLTVAANALRVADGVVATLQQGTA